jgi:hypothetical protein
VSKITKLLNHPILFFKDAYKKHGIKILEVISAQLPEKNKVTPPPPRILKKSLMKVSRHGLIHISVIP